MNADAWRHLRSHTSARIALGRAGGSMPTDEVLRFALDHAEARDAVHAVLDIDALRDAVATLKLETIVVTSQAANRVDYLRRPCAGRVLSGASRQSLAATAKPCDVVLILADGLSATATQQHGATLAALLVKGLTAGGFTLGPMIIAEQARVALQDDIGFAIGARVAIILLGERPGLGSADSLGAYVVFDPKRGNTDANRNCVSNIRPAGLPIACAADTLLYLITESLRRKLSGVSLKDERDLLLNGSAATPRVSDR